MRTKAIAVGLDRITAARESLEARGIEERKGKAKVIHLQLGKRDLQSPSKDMGLRIVVKPLSANAVCSIQCNFEFNSHGIDISDLHLDRQELYRTSTGAGT
jgi:hypothetical protein